MELLASWQGWNAVGSLATAAALVWAIALASSQRAENRRRDRAFVHAVIAAIRPGAYAARDIVELHDSFVGEKSQDDADFRKLITNDPLRFIEATSVEADRIDLSRFPSRRLIERFVFFKIHLGHVRHGLKRYLEEGGPPSIAAGDAPQLMEAFDAFIKEARRFGAKDRPVMD